MARAPSRRFRQASRRISPATPGRATTETTDDRATPHRPSTEGALQPIEEAAVVAPVGILIELLAELGEQLALLRVQLARHADLDVYAEISRPAALQRRHSPPV